MQRLVVRVSVKGILLTPIEGHGLVGGRPIGSPLQRYAVIQTADWSRRVILRLWARHILPLQRRIVHSDDSEVCGRPEGRPYHQNDYLFVGCFSIALSYCHFVSLGQQRVNLLLQSRAAGIQDAHPIHPAIDRMRQQLIEGSEIVAAGSIGR